MILVFTSWFRLGSQGQKGWIISGPSTHRSLNVAVLPSPLAIALRCSPTNFFLVLLPISIPGQIDRGASDTPILFSPSNQLLTLLTSCCGGGSSNLIQRMGTLIASPNYSSSLCFRHGPSFPVNLNLGLDFNTYSPLHWAWSNAIHIPRILTSSNSFV